MIIILISILRVGRSDEIGCPPPNPINYLNLRVYPIQQTIEEGNVKLLKVHIIFNRRFTQNYRGCIMTFSGKQFLQAEKNKLWQPV